MPQQQSKNNALNEHKVQLALAALKQDPKLSERRAAAIYSVPRTTLHARRVGRPSRDDSMANSRNITNAEEEAIVKYVLELVEHGHPPRLLDVANMANCLREERGLGPVGSNWASTFVSRTPELKVKFNRKYDYKRALCEDSGVIQGWFSLVANIKAKYGILDANTYNFNETGFTMGQISSRAVVTAADLPRQPKSIQPGNREWVTVT